MSPALIELYATDVDALCDRGDALIAHALAESGASVPAKENAWRVLAVIWARQHLDGVRPVAETTAAFFGLMLHTQFEHKELHRLYELHEFVEWGDPHGRMYRRDTFEEELARDVRDAASELLVKLERP